MVKASKNATLEAMQGAKGKYFDLVKSAAHWKDPIDAMVEVPQGTSPRELILAISDAVIFFAGCVPQITIVQLEEGTALRVKAVGYFAAIGA